MYSRERRSGRPQMRFAVKFAAVCVHLAVRRHMEEGS